MSKYPFADYANRYMETMRGVYTPATWATKSRRYARLHRDVVFLKESGRLSTASPKDMTAEDVRECLLFHKEKVAVTDMVHEVVAWRQLMAYVHNPALEECLVKYPGVRPHVAHQRKPSLDLDVYQRMLDRANELDSSQHKLVRAYALVLLCIRTGTRNKEIRLANVEDIDVSSWMFDIVHVKGEASYGMTRAVPIHPDIRYIVETYLVARKKYMLNHHYVTHALFPGPNGYLSSNSIRCIKDLVSQDLGVDFDLRLLRRTFGQMYLDAGLDIESASVLMGHASTKTTEGYYSRRKLSKAVESARDTW